MHGVIALIALVIASWEPSSDNPNLRGGASAQRGLSSDWPNLARADEPSATPSPTGPSGRPAEPDAKEIAAQSLRSLPRPDGPEIGDLRAIFLKPGAPPAGSLDRCDFDVKVNKELSQTPEEYDFAVGALVRGDPVRYHWCIYGLMLSLHEGLRKPDFIDEKQKRVLDTYTFVAAVARAFLREFGIADYLRIATALYQKLNRAYFHRVVEVPREMRMQMATPEAPLVIIQNPKTGPSPGASPEPEGFSFF